MTPPSPSEPTWSDLAGARVGVWGIGVEGRANLRRLEALGTTPAAVVDDRPGSPSVLATADGGLAALAGCDVVVKSPGISRYREDLRALEAGGVPVYGGLGLWLAGADRSRVACITGTKGKSTTTAITAHLGGGLGEKVLPCGNFGIAPWDPETPAADWWIVETSSYQATDVTVGPAVVAVTSLGEDHLPWHHGVENYYRDKLALCTKPGVRTVVAADVPELRARLIERVNGDLGQQRGLAQSATGGPVSGGLAQSATGGLGGPMSGGPAEPVTCGLTGPVTWANGDAGWAAGLALPGDHNLRNALVARAVLVALGVPGASDDPRIAAAAEGFAGLGSRLRTIGSAGGVSFVDDSLSTNVLPTLAAVEAFRGRRLALLVGGEDRGIDYTPLATGLASRPDLLVLTMPDSGPRIAGVLRAAGVPVRECTSLDDAVTSGYAWLAGEGVLLLSPAAPSFGRYANYQDRSTAFAAATTHLP